AIFQRSLTRLPQRSINDFRVARIDLHIAPADVLIAIKKPFKCFATIDRSLNPALLVRPVWMTGYRYKDAIRIFWINRQLRDLLTVAPPEMRPRFSGVGRFVNSDHT